MEIHRTRSFNPVSIVSEPDFQVQEQRLKVTIGEINRLLHFPDVFPSESVRTKFLALIALDSDLQFHGACTALLLQSELEAIDHISEKRSKEIYSKYCVGWDNFLLNMAPGAPDDLSNRAKTEPESSFQVVPAVGLRIVADLEREERDIVRYVEQASTDDCLSVSVFSLTLDTGTSGPQSISSTNNIDD